MDHTEEFPLNSESSKRAKVKTQGHPDNSTSRRLPLREEDLFD